MHNLTAREEGVLLRTPTPAATAHLTYRQKKLLGETVFTHYIALSFLQNFQPVQPDEIRSSKDQHLSDHLLPKDKLDILSHPTVSSFRMFCLETSGWIHLFPNPFAQSLSPELWNDT